MDQKQPDNKQVLQALFDASVGHILKQGKPSYTLETRACRYRNADGTSCGAAPFIMTYDPNMEYKGWHTLAERWPNHITQESQVHADFVCRLQGCHDVAAHDGVNGVHEEGKVPFLSAYVVRATNLAASEGLSTKVILDWQTDRAASLS